MPATVVFWEMLRMQGAGFSIAKPDLHGCRPVILDDPVSVLV